MSMLGCAGTAATQSGGESGPLKVNGEEQSDHVRSALPEQTGSYAWYALCVLTLVYVFNNMDRQLITILAEDIKRDLGLSDVQIGILYGTAFGIFYAVIAIPFARLADRCRRTRLIALSLATWSGMTAVTGFSRHYIDLAIARMGVGAGEAAGGASAPSSLIADYFPKQRRGLALAIYMTGANIGGAISLPLGATIASSWNRVFAGAQAPLGLTGWQAAFLAVGVPGLLLAIWVYSLREPPREGAEPFPEANSTAGVPSLWRYLGGELAAILPPLTLANMARHPRGLVSNLALLAFAAGGAAALAVATQDTFQWAVYGLGIYAIGSWMQNLKRTDPAVWRQTLGARPFLMLIVSIGCLSAVQAAFFLWTPSYLLRSFYSAPNAPAHFLGGISAREEISYVALAAGLASVVSMILGGWLSDRWRMRDERGRLAVIALSAIVCVPFLLVLYSVPNLLVCFICWPLAAAALQLIWGPGLAAVREFVTPNASATALAFTSVFNAVLGWALGPYVAGKVAAITGSISAGIFSLFALIPLVLWLLWRSSLGISANGRTDSDCASIAG